ncbi:hypothetical protein CJP74_04410 [Psittacicella melopsittaci]|uniref:Porin n=1 Tax=Psittacicella melopsittaci TaxID=2028576 RepID=A0A3A1Y8P0_9GAMM|nr:hypothetical protein [Psittacicella melopsittaci]RIY32494.1 hypothetical protein CJP74_04410 [Psittacicella melopsittaci]
MKKTLLALAVAGLATSAFANTNVYSYTNGNTSANLGVFAQARYVFADYQDKDRLADSKEDSRLSQGRLRFGLYGSIKDSNNLTYSFYTRFQSRFQYTSTKTDGVKEAGVHKRDGVDVNRAYVQLSHPTFGSVLYGKYVTVADDKFGDDLEHGANWTRFTAFDVETGYDSVFTYLAPEFYGVKGGLSYGETKTSQYVYSKQLALQAAYNFFGNHVVFTYANTRDRSYGKTVTNTNSYDLAFYNDGLVQDFVVGGDVAYQQLTDTDNTYRKHYLWSVAGKVAYTGFQYAQPFFNASYVEEKAARLKTKATNLAVGAASDVYTYQTAKVTVFGEYYYSRERTTDRFDTKNEKHTYKGFNVGAILSF